MFDHYARRLIACFRLCLLLIITTTKEGAYLDKDTTKNRSKTMNGADGCSHLPCQPAPGLCCMWWVGHDATIKGSFYQGIDSFSPML